MISSRMKMAFTHTGLDWSWLGLYVLVCIPPGPCTVSGTQWLLCVFDEWKSEWMMNGWVNGSLLGSQVDCHVNLGWGNKGKVISRKFLKKNKTKNKENKASVFIQSRIHNNSNLSCFMGDGFWFSCMFWSIRVLKHELLTDSIVLGVKYLINCIIVVILLLITWVIF